MSAKAVARSLSSGEVRSLEVGLSRSVDLDLLRNILAELFRAFPNLRLKLRRGAGGDIAELLKSGDIQLGVAGPIGHHWDRLDAWPMFSESFEILVGSSHPIAARNTGDFELEALRGEALLVHAGSETAEEEADSLRARGISRDEAHHVDCMRDLVDLVESNVGVVLAPMSLMRSSRVARYALPGVDLRRTVSVFTVAGRARSPEASTLLNLIRTTDWAAVA